MTSQRKPLHWVGSTRADIGKLPDDAKRQLGYALLLVQAGLEPRDWKPMPSVGKSVVELRVRAGGAFRLLYIAKWEEAVYVLHVFQKKSRKTSMLDLALARARYAKLLRALHRR